MSTSRAAVLARARREGRKAGLKHRLSGTIPVPPASVTDGSLLMRQVASEWHRGLGEGRRAIAPVTIPPKALGGQPRHAVELVGPAGYEHGWRFVGIPGDSLGAHTADGKIKPARAALHEKIIRNSLAGHDKSAQPVARFMGGGPASGKSTVMKAGDPGVLIDSDAIKGQLSEYRAMTKAGNQAAAAYAHEESSVIAKKIMARAARAGMSFTLDGTGDSGYQKLSEKVAEARKSGHKVHAAYVTIDSDEAVKRAAKRAARTGRVVPEPVIREIHSSVTRTFAEAVGKNLFDSAELWDNNGAKPVLVGSKPEGGRWTVHDPAAWGRFLAKGKT